jgi:hypothetical protein
MRFEPDECRLQHSHDEGSGAWTPSIDENHFVGFGVGDELPTDVDQERQESEAAHCFQRVKIDTTKLDCNENSGFCQTHEYIRLDKDDPSIGISVESSKVPKHVRDALNTEEFLPTRYNDGRYLGPPAETERPCFELPGPADPKLYCTRLQSGTWVGFKWYRFVDQPELNQVFASIENRAQRDKTKCYMQERIERLHEAVNNGGELPRWFRPPQGDDKMPANLVSIDPGSLVTPPDGLEKGFVPVPMWERNRQPSPDCDVFLGEHSSEPDPFPDDYYDGFVNDDGDYINQECPAILESQELFTFPGTVYPYPFKDDEERKPYDVPLKEDVASVLDEIPVNCGT